MCLLSFGIAVIVYNFVWFFCLQQEINMSDDEPQTSAPKRAHESPEQNTGDGDEEEDDDGWIGPLPTEAAPAKKRKGI